MRCLASNYKSKFHQATFLAVFNLQWTLAIRNSKETGNLFDILAITSSVQNLACIKFGDWQKSVFLAGIKFGQLKDLLNWCGFTLVNSKETFSTCFLCEHRQEAFSTRT